MRIFRRLLPFASPLANVLFFQLLLLLAFCVVHKAAFCLGDDQYYVDHICKGVPMGWHIVKSAGRCTPFTHVDLNCLLLLPICFRPYFAKISYLINAAFLCASCWLLTKVLLRTLRGCGFSEWMTLAGVAFFVCAPKVLLVHTWDVFPECRMIFLMLAFALLLARGIATDRLRWLALAALAQLIMYGYKETSFILTSVAAGTLFVFGRNALSRRVWRTTGAMAFLGAVYCLVYYLGVYRFAVSTYHADRAVSFFSGFLYYFSNPFMAAALALCLWRAGVRILRNRADHLLPDALLFAAIAFSLAYPVLGFTDVYYVAPAYAFLVPVFVHWIGWLLDCGSRRMAIAACVLLALTGICNFWSARCLWDWTQMRRETELPTLRMIAACPEVREILYYLPETTNDSWYYRENFRHLLGYAGGDRLSFGDVKSVPRNLSRSQVLVVPRLEGLPPGIERRLPSLSPHSRELDWHYVVFGPREVVSE